jgi:hypothetical protein
MSVAISAMIVCGDPLVDPRDCVQRVNQSLKCPHLGLNVSGYRTDRRVQGVDAGQP